MNDYSQLACRLFAQNPRPDRADGSRQLQYTPGFTYQHPDAGGFLRAASLT
jgi:hypothetical protein